MDTNVLGMSRGRVRIGAAALTALALLIPAAGEAQSPGTFTPTRQGGIPGALLPDELHLWQWDPATSTYVQAEGDASQPYVPNLDRTAPEGTSIAFAEGLAAIPFSAVINEGIHTYAQQMGFDVPYCDTAFDAAKAVACAEQLSQQAPDFVINSNWQAGAGPAMMDIFDAAGIPTTSIDVVHPNAIFMGADNYTSGFIAGQHAGQRVADLGHCADVWIYVGENLGEGEAANQRLVGFKDGVQTLCGPIPDDRFGSEIFDQQSAEQALTKTTDWLTAHPQATFIAATSIDDARADGIAKALAQSGRDGVAVGLGCDTIGIEATKAAPPEESRFLGCVAYFPERYPDYVVSIALDVLEGKAVPQEVHIAHEFLDRDTISSVYP
jgi:ribose transport system substrate-binding protein